LEGNQHEWFELAQELRVDAVALEVLVEIVRRGKWRTSTAPLLYLRINVGRLSEKWQDPFADDGKLRHAQIFSQMPTREDRPWMKIWSQMQELNATVTPADIDAASETLKVVQNEGERGVLCARALGLTRAQYLAGVSDSERRKRAAAWRRLHRHGVPTELRKALRRVSNGNAIMRPGFEDRAWRDSKDDVSSELPSKPTSVPRYDRDFA
jgi:hypothetical protein